MQDPLKSSDGVVAHGDGDAASDGPRSQKARDAYTELHRGIRSGEYAPGFRLKEIDLAAQLGMSRTPIREAIRQLERDGVVTVLPNRGAIVRELSEQEIDDTYSLRAVLEGYCASRAASRIDPVSLKRMEEIQDEFERRIQPDGSIEDESVIDGLILLNKAFHNAIVIGSRNTRVIDILQKATEVPVQMKQLYWRSERARASARIHHREILEALRARDAVRADAVMRTHVYSVKDFFMQQHRATGLQRLVDDRAAGGDAKHKR
jgi:DNA-binding GntR family transcriptional regulator